MSSSCPSYMCWLGLINRRCRMVDIPKFARGGIVTGRMSCKDPKISNVPKRDVVSGLGFTPSHIFTWDQSKGRDKTSIGVCGKDISLIRGNKADWIVYDDFVRKTMKFAPVVPYHFYQQFLVNDYVPDTILLLAHD